MIRAGSIIPYLRAAVFLAVAAVVFGVLSRVCVSTNWIIANWPSYRTLREMKDIPFDAVDVAFFGASAAQWGILPLLLYDEYGIRAQNLAVASQTPFESYWQMEEFLRTHSVKVFLYEPSTLFRNITFPNFRLILDTLPYSSHKIALKNYHKIDDPKDSLLSGILPLVKYHSVWKQLKESSFQPLVYLDYMYYFGGILANGRVAPSNAKKAALFRGWTEVGEQIEKIEYQYEYFVKIAHLCREKNISLVLFKTPMVRFWTPEMHNAVQKAANEMGVPFIDFNLQNVLIDSGYDFTTDMGGDLAHPNRFGAEKMSRYLGRYLRDSFLLPDRRSDPKYAYMYDDLARYKREMFLLNFPVTDTMPRWLELLGSTDINNYTVIFSVREDAQAKIGGEIIGKLRELGFKDGAFFKEAGLGFIGVWQNGKAVYERQSKTEALEYRSVLPDGMKYYVKSERGRGGKVSSIVINGVEYGKNLRGFNVVLYDNATGRVVDSINWDTHVDAGLTFKR